MILSIMDNNNPHNRTNIYSPQTNTNKNKQSLKKLRQDNSRFFSARSASHQPAPVTKCDRAPALNNVIVCSHYPNSHQNRTVKLTLWVKPIVKDELERQAKREGLSLSASGAAFLEKALQQHIDLQYTALLEPIIQKAINKHLLQLRKTNTHLLVRIAYDVGQIRGIVTNILSNLPGMTQNLVRGIVINSEKTAKGNIARLTPQMKELIDKVKERLLSQEGDEKAP